MEQTSANFTRKFIRKSAAGLFEIHQFSGKGPTLARSAHKSGAVQLATTTWRYLELQSGVVQAETLHFLVKGRPVDIKSIGR